MKIYVSLVANTYSPRYQTQKQEDRELEAIYTARYSYIYMNIYDRQADR